MKPPRFAYLAPASIDEALEQLAQHGDSAKLLAGGQSLVPLLNFRLARPEVLIDLNGVPGLDFIGEDPGTHEIAIGALVRQTDAEHSPVVGASCPLLANAISHVGHRAIRNRGTVGGSVAHADPAAEIPLVLAALGGRARLARAGSTRWVPAPEFFVSYLTTAIEPDELLVELRFPSARSDGYATGWGFDEFSRRHGDFALAAAAASISLDAEGQIAQAALAVAGGGPFPQRMDELVTALMGRRFSGALAREVARATASACDVDADPNVSSDYRRTLLAAVTESALQRAWATATATA